MNREIVEKVKGFRTTDGAGVSLVRVLGHDTVRSFDPILMLDSFDSTNPDDYTAGFPFHPHRGIETISYLYKGKMIHADSIGNSDELFDGGVQWMNSGSGIMHEEKVPASERLLGVQLWLNLPQKEKMSKPYYHNVKSEEIEEIEFDGGYLRLLAGKYKDHEGYSGEHLPLDYYDIHLNKGAKFTLDTDKDASVMAFTLLKDVKINGELIEEKTAVKFSEGDSVEFEAVEDDTQVLFMSSKKLDEDIAWAGPIVMNTDQEVRNAWMDLRTGNFIKEEIEY